MLNRVYALGVVLGLGVGCSSAPASQNDAGEVVAAMMDGGDHGAMADAALGADGGETATAGSGAHEDASVAVQSDAAVDWRMDATVVEDSPMVLGVNVHAYPKPTAYGYTAADGKDRMGEALQAIHVTAVRGPTIGDTDFIARLASFGVKEIILGLNASSHGKPFNPASVGPMLQASLDVANTVGVAVVVEGLNEWDLFNTKAYNAGVLPAGMSASEFVLFTQKALYEAAHPLGIQVLGPSVGHGGDPDSRAFFPDVSDYVDIVNIHLYFTANPEALMIAKFVSDHEVYQGSGKPLWVTETGWSAYNGVSLDAQADIIRRGIDIFAGSHLVDRMFIYELLDNQKPGWNGSSLVPESAEYHFGLFDYEGAPKPAATAATDYVGAPKP